MSMIIFLLSLNFAISWLNCWAVGRSWNESKAVGGLVRLLAWCGVVQAVIGFSSVVGFSFGAGLYLAGYLPARAAQGAASLWYLLVIVPALGTGIIITIESWVAAMRDRSLTNIGIASYNTLAQLHNIASAVDDVPTAIADVIGMFSGSGDEDNGLAAIAVALVASALLGGALLTTILIKRYAGSLPLPARAASAI